MRYLLQHYFNHRMLLSGAGLLALSLSACNHAEAVRDLVPEQGDGDGDGDFVGDGDGDNSHLEGEDPTVALTPTESEIGDGEDFEEPIVEEGNRMSCGDSPVRDKYIPDASKKDEAEGLLAQMTIEQKVVQLTGLGSPDYGDGNRWEDIQRSRDEPGLNIRGYRWRDGPHGLNLESGLGRDQLENYSTSFPTTVAQGATFDMELVFAAGEAMGDETLALGDNVLLGPCMNVLRHPYWGRAQETFGEDTFHLGRMGTALAEGIQQYIAGCAKHYIANNIDSERFSISSDMDEQTLREVYARHFEMVVRDGGVACMMASYNSINDKKQTQNKHTLTEMLRYDMAFKGFVLTDWWAMPGANNGQGPVNAPQDSINAAEALTAGLDIEVPWALNFDAIPSIVADGTLDGRVVDRAVLRVLEQKLRFNSAYLDEADGLKETTTTYKSNPGSIFDSEDHADLAQVVAEKGMVLLKNDNNALPIDPETVTTVAIIGATIDYEVPSDFPKEKKFNFVTDVALGDRGSSRVRTDPALTTGPLAGMTEFAPEGVQIISGDSADDVQDADFVVVIVGLTAGHEGEEYTGASDRNSLSLEDKWNGTMQDDLVRAVIAKNKPTVVIVQAGGVIDMPWIGDVDAAVMAWYPGQRSGAALGRLLFGETNFAGRLPVTWPTSIDQFPTFNEGDSTYMDYYVGYRRFDVMGLTPLYAFGHGLSYSEFRYERLHIPCEDISDNGMIQVEVDVRNVNGIAGDEVIQVYASYPETEARRSIKELRGFARVHLEEGEGKRVSIPIRVQDLKYWDTDADSWVVETGPVLLQIGPSSDNLLLEQTITVN